jgi:hypothetical protein
MIPLKKATMQAEEATAIFRQYLIWSRDERRPE